MSQRTTLVLVAALLVSLLGASALNGVPYFGFLFVASSIASLLLLSAALVRGEHKPKYTDPYDLRLLLEVHERSEFEQQDSTREEGDILCPHCGHLHGPMLKVCPQCKRLP